MNCSLGSRLYYPPFVCRFIGAYEIYMTYSFWLEGWSKCVCIYILMVYCNWILSVCFIQLIDPLLPSQLKIKLLTRIRKIMFFSLSDFSFLEHCYLCFLEWLTNKQLGYLLLSPGIWLNVLVTRLTTCWEKSLMNLCHYSNPGSGDHTQKHALVCVLKMCRSCLFKHCIQKVFLCVIHRLS